MVTTTTVMQPGEVSGSVMFYKNPEPLSPEKHGKMGLKRTDTPFAFAAKTNLVPLTVAEFGLSAISYPIIFVGEDRSPAAVLGLRDDENLFVEKDGTYDPNSYIPAFIRRVPFVFANDDKEGRLILCVDTSSELLDPKGTDIPLFVDGDKLSPYTEGAMTFCQEFEGERLRTVEFVKLLTELDLFEIKKATFTPVNADGSNGETQTVAEYFAISEAKLQALPDAKLAELNKNGALQQIYHSLTSLANWDRLIGRAMRRQAAAAND